MVGVLMVVSTKKWLEDVVTLEYNLEALFSIVFPSFRRDCMDSTLTSPVIAWRVSCSNCSCSVVVHGLNDLVEGSSARARVLYFCSEAKGLGVGV